jgi:hypothetical protein
MARRKYGARALTSTERRQLHDRRKRRRKRRLAMVEDFNAIAAMLSRDDIDRFEASGILPKPFLAALREQMRLIREQSEQNLDYWRIATGESWDVLFRRELLALQAWRWEWLERRADPERWPDYPGERRPDRFDGGWVETEDEDGSSKQRIISWPLRLRDQFQAENAHDGGGSAHHEAAALWALRKALGRHGQSIKLKLKDGTETRVSAAWAVGPARSISVSPELKKLYRGNLVWEWFRWRFRPPDLTDKTWDTDRLIGPPGGQKNRAAWKLPVAALSIGDASLTNFAKVWWWHPGRGLDWSDRPEKSGVALRTKEPELFDWNKGFDTPEFFTSRIGYEPTDDEDLDDRKLGRALDSNPTCIEMFADGSFAVHRASEPKNHARMRKSFPAVSCARARSGVVGYFQRSPGWVVTQEAPGANLPAPDHDYWAGVKGRPVTRGLRAMVCRLPDSDALDRLATSAAIEAGL